MANSAINCTSFKHYSGIQNRKNVLFCNIPTHGCIKMSISVNEIRRLPENFPGMFLNRQNLWTRVVKQEGFEAVCSMRPKCQTQLPHCSKTKVCLSNKEKSF